MIKNLFSNKEFKNAGWLIGGKVLQMVISFLVGILTARYLGPANYGLIGYGNAYVSFFTALCSLGINSIIIKDFYDNPNEQGKAIGTTLVLRIISSLLSVIMIWGISSIVDKDNSLTIFIVFLCSLGLIFNIFDVFNYWFQSQYKSKIPSIVTVIAYIVMSAYKVLLLFLEAEVQWFALSMSLDYLVVALLLLIVYFKNKGQKLSFSIIKAKELLGKSYHYIISSFMVAVYTQTDKFMIKQMNNEADVGYYTTASTISTIWVFILQAIIDSMYPTILKLYKEDQEAYRKKNKQLYAIVFYLSLIVWIIFLIAGDFVIGVLYGGEYLSAAPILKILAIYNIFSYIGVARNAWIVCEGKQKYLKYMYFGGAIINIILNLLLIPLMGASGAALASVITQVFTNIILPCFFKGMRENVKLIFEAIFLINTL